MCAALLSFLQALDMIDVCPRRDWWPVEDWRPRRALVREDKPSEWCWGAKGILASGGGLSAACLQQVLLGPEIKVGWGRVWLWRVTAQPACLVGYLWPFKVPLCLSAQLVTKSLADRLPVSPTAVLVQHCFSCFFIRVGGLGLHHTTSPEGRQLGTREASSTHRQQTARQEKTGTSHTKEANHLTAGLFCSAG